MPAVNGEEYIQRLNSLKSTIWIEGEKVDGNVSEHPAFKGVIHNQARLFDFQIENEELMTFLSPKTGERVGTSFLIPKSKEDLEKRRLMIQEWAKLSGGMLGRSPDYINTVLMTFTTAAELLTIQDTQFADNLRRFFEHVRENDLTLTHTFIHPQVNRSAMYKFSENETQIIAAQPIKKTSDGLVIKGARLLATQGGITDELLVLPSSSGLYNSNFAYGFSIPSNTSGLSFICRESFSYKDSTYDHPLGSRFEEPDAIVVFNDVLVPWDRVFFHNHTELAYKIYYESEYHVQQSHQVLCRRVVKTEFLLGIAQLLTETIKIGEYEHVQMKISEIITGLETLKALLIASEVNAKVNQWGVMTPEQNLLKVATNLYPQLYPRFMEILQLLGASGLVSIPTEKDFSAPIKPDLQLYLQAASAEAEDRVQIFRLAWDICMSAFGTRQTLYEQFFAGDPIRLSTGLYQTYDKKPAMEFVKKFLEQ